MDDYIAQQPNPVFVTDIDHMDMMGKVIVFMHFPPSGTIDFTYEACVFDGSGIFKSTSDPCQSPEDAIRAAGLKNVDKYYLLIMNKRIRDFDIPLFLIPKRAYFVGLPIARLNDKNVKNTTHVGVYMEILTTNKGDTR